MKLEDFVVDNLEKTTTYENNFKHLMNVKNIKKIFPEKSFHGKDETFQYEDGKSLFQEAMKLDPATIEQKITKKKEISPGYMLNKLKRKAESDIISDGKEESLEKEQEKVNIGTKKKLKK